MIKVYVLDSTTEEVSQKTFLELTEEDFYGGYCYATTELDVRTCDDFSLTAPVGTLFKLEGCTFLFSYEFNGLKINYIIGKLYQNPIYREYKINYLAEECGFSTPRVFLNAFKKETDLTPSYFIKELQNEKVS